MFLIGTEVILVTDSYRKTLTDVSFILKNMPSKDVQSLPKKLIDFIEQNKDAEYVPLIDTSKNISKQNLAKETLSFLAMIYWNYWCEDSFEKDDLRKVFDRNEYLHRNQLLFDWH